MSNKIRPLPKVLLHDHLDGGLRPQTVIELAQDQGHVLPENTAAQLQQWFEDNAHSGSLEDYLSTFEHTVGVMQTASSLRRVAKEAVEDLAEDNIVYVELRFAPLQHTSTLSDQEVVDAVVTGIKEGELAVASVGKTIYARVILCALRTGSAQDSLRVAELTIQNHGFNSPGKGYVVGFDLAGAEKGFPAHGHEEAFALLRENLIPFTIHAGEAAGPGSMRDALAQGSRRLGHGVRIFEDITVSDSLSESFRLGDTALYVRDMCVPLELALTSNVQTGVVDSVEDHPFGFLYELGFTLTVNTDNRLLAGSTLSDEFTTLMDNYGFEMWQILEFTMNALQSAFCDQPLRKELEQIIYQGFNPYLGQDSSDQLGEGHSASELTHAEDLELSMDRLREELAEFGLDLDDDGSEDDGQDSTHLF